MPKSEDRYDVQLSLEVTKISVRDGVPTLEKFNNGHIGWPGMTLEQVNVMEDLFVEGAQRLRQVAKGGKSAGYDPNRGG